MSTTDATFPWPVRLGGLVGLAGVGTFLISLFALHFFGGDIDWMGDYVSNLANGPYGWLFFVGTYVHGWGNLALGLGLYGALRPDQLRSWGVWLFSVAAAGILLTALFPTDPPGEIVTVTGFIHRTAASTGFMFELAAAFVFTLAFQRQRRWCRQYKASLILSVSAAIAVLLYVIAIQLGVAQGLAERVALAILMGWELWAIYHLVL